MDTRFTSIMTIGLGMIGSSFVMAYRAAYPDSYIIGVDISQDTIDEAQEHGLMKAYSLPMICQRRFLVVI